MKQSIYLLFVAVVWAAVSHGEPARAGKRHHSNTVAEILSNIDATAKRVHSFQAMFKQTEVDPVFDELYESSGKFYFNKMIHGTHKDAPVYQLRFDYMTPEKSVTIIDGAKVIMYAPDMQKPQESYLVDDVKMQAFFAAFMSTEGLREHYEVVVTEESARTVTILLVPKTDTVRRHFRELRITFKRTTWLPISIYQHKHNGQQITFTFDRIQLNRTVPPELFTAKGLRISGKRARRPAKSGKKTEKKRSAGQ